MAKTKESKSLLLHPTRRRIYSLLCENPGTYLFMIAKLLDLPQGTLTWHIQQLEQAGYLSSFKFGGKRVYFPSELRRPEIERIFLVLQSELSSLIFLYVLNNPGCHQSSIARDISLDVAIHYDTLRYHLERMEEVGLVEFQREGKYVNCFPGHNAKILQKGSINIISDSYVAFLTQKFSEEGLLLPVVVEQSENRLILQMESPNGEKILFEINLKGWSWDLENGSLDLQNKNKKAKLTNNKIR
ncbi:MAG: winged helix-turn-helix transcriptional regulator [Candidatus Hermodarchaeota archaeon]